MQIGSGIILLSTTTKRLLLARRSDSNSWANFGGSMEDFETTYQCVIREMKEETGFDHGIQYRIYGKKPYHKKETGNFTYYTYVGSCDGEPVPSLDAENTAYGWFALDSLPIPLHFCVEESLSAQAVVKILTKLSGNIE